MPQPKPDVRRDFADLLVQAKSHLSTPQANSLWDSMSELLKNEGQGVAMAWIETELRTMEDDAKKAILQASQAQPKDVAP